MEESRLPPALCFADRVPIARMHHQSKDDLQREEEKRKTPGNISHMQPGPPDGWVVGDVASQRGLAHSWTDARELNEADKYRTSIKWHNDDVSMGSSHVSHRPGGSRFDLFLTIIDPRAS